MNQNKSYTETVYENFKKHRLGVFSLIVIIIFCLVGVYAPFLASSKPIIVNFDGTWYFPLFRYLFFSGFYTKPLDLFFNLTIFTLPLIVLNYYVFKKQKKYMYPILGAILLLQMGLFIYIVFSKPQDPSQDLELIQDRQAALKELKVKPTFAFDLKYMSPYKKLNLLLNYRLLKEQNERLKYLQVPYEKKAMEHFLELSARDKRAYLLRSGTPLKDIPNKQQLKELALKNTPEDLLKAKIQMPTLWNTDAENRKHKISSLKEELEQNPDNLKAKTSLNYIQDKEKWLRDESNDLRYLVMPLISSFHFEDDAGGEQRLNQYVPWWELSRTNRKSLMAALIFGVRVSLVVGVLAVGLSLLISVPVGAYAGYYGGTFDIIVSRILEVLEAMPTFFMLLMIIAITQSKSIFLVILMIGLFGWTGFSRYIRGEFFKQRNLAYVQSCHALGFRDSYIMFSHILPNAIPPLLTLLPFAMMSAITAEAGLSFLGLGEEGSASWGVLMDEGRSAFPSESYLLWPPAILLTILLVAIALVGDGLRDAIDPKMR